VFSNPGSSRPAIASRASWPGASTAPDSFYDVEVIGRRIASTDAVSFDMSADIAPAITSVGYDAPSPAVVDSF
jgi:hypothetical protein